MSKQDEFEMDLNSIKLDPHATRHMVNQVIDETLKNRTCPICESGFETTEQRDSVQTVMINKKVIFVHLECRDEAIKRFRKKGKV